MSVVVVAVGVIVIVTTPVVVTRTIVDVETERPLEETEATLVSV